MLEALRKKTTGIIAKILIGLLILSFAVWGIGDMITGIGRNVVATVGPANITANEFQYAYQRAINNFSRQFGRRLTPAEGKTFGIESQVISNLTGTAALDNHAQELNLTVSEKLVENAVRSDPTFNTSSGFDHVQFQNILRQFGYTEEQYFEQRYKDTIRGQLTDSLLLNVSPPNAMLELFRTYRDEKRIAKYVKLDPEKHIKVGEPADADLKKTYDENKRRFVETEYRKFQVLMLSSDAARKMIKITDAEIKQIYESEKEAYAVAEERRIQQIPFKDAAAAEKARQEIIAGKDFVEVAKANGAKETDIDLGMKRKDQLIDSKIADTAFNLEKDKVSEVTKGQFTTVLLRVTEIKEGKQRTLEEVKDEIRGSIANTRAPEKVQDLQNQVDDNRLAGKSLKEIAALLKLPFADVEKANSQGETPDGKPAFESPDRIALARAVFAAEVGVEKEVIELSDGGYAWVNLIAVTPEKQKPFDKVKEDVKKTWRELAIQKALREKAEALAKRIDGGESIESVAKELATEVKTSPEFRRGDSLPEFSQAAVTRAFTLPIGKAGEAPSSGNTSRVVLEVTKIVPPGEDKSPQAEQFVRQVEQQLRTDIVAQYVANLQSRMGVEVNQQIIDLTTGAATLQQANY